MPWQAFHFFNRCLRHRYGLDSWSIHRNVLTKALLFRTRTFQQFCSVMADLEWHEVRVRDDSLSCSEAGWLVGLEWYPPFLSLNWIDAKGNWLADVSVIAINTTKELAELWMWLCSLELGCCIPSHLHQLHISFAQSSLSYSLYCLALLIALNSSFSPASPKRYPSAVSFPFGCLLMYF